jgi:2-polyprenyl-3-methyl-5-hydroxy-6-metoxy-1,4-benzoquinol methylase
MADASCAYPGGELEVFAKAVNWRAYWGAQLRPYLGRRVLEVGAGLGSVTLTARPDEVDRWTALEPDRDMAERLSAKVRGGALAAICDVRTGTTAALGEDERFDTILYVDVLEHIAEDRAELALASRHLESGGHLVVLAPAHRALYTAFDAAIGHHRRYSRAALLALTPRLTTPVRSRYLDSVGMLASLGNRLLLRSSNPTLAQILIWDRFMVRPSRLIDPVLGFRVGKSVLVVWRKHGETE